MRHEYYQYNKEQLLTNPRMPLHCKADNAEVFKEMADQMVEEIRSKQRKGRKDRIYLSGRSGRPVSLFCGYGK